MGSDEPLQETALPLRSMHQEVQAAVPLFEGGHLQESVRKASGRYINRVGELAGRSDLVASDLMKHAFSEQKPVLVLSGERESLTDRNLHQGNLLLATGLVAGVRNIYTHVDELPVDTIEALEWLAFISAMHRRLDRVEQIGLPKEEDPDEGTEAEES